MRYKILVTLLASVAMFSLEDAAIADRDKKEKEVAIEDMTIADIMKAAHKKPKRLLKKVATGAAKRTEKEELLELYKALAKLDPPKGDAASWKAKTTLLVEAAGSLNIGCSTHSENRRKRGPYFSSSETPFSISTYSSCSI